mgnify:CR=1 FL=1
MNIGSVIKKYRKEAGYTQEEMANRLGVTTPAVNKWENGNSKPDIELLSPIARLLHISLDTLLSFQEKLTDFEIGEFIQKMDKMFSEEGYEKTYQWAVNTIKKYPNCNLLIWQIAVMLDSRRIIGECDNPDKYDEQINAWYEIALNDEEEKIQHHAADSLFGFYLRKKNYEMAEKYLNYGNQIVIIKHGKKGSVAYGADKEAFKVDSYKIKLLKSFGGGDAYASAFIYGLLEGWSLADSLRHGTAHAAMVVASHSCSEAMQDAPAIDAFIQEHAAEQVITPVEWKVVL